MRLANALEPAPYFPSEAGEFEVDYRDYNGKISIGSGDWKFTTLWSTAGPGAIYIYNDSSDVKHVAVAPGAKNIPEVTEDVFQRANFTSRARSPKVGQVALLENINGFAAAIEILKVTLTDDGEPGTVLHAKYQILTDKSCDFSRGENSIYVDLQNSVTQALHQLNRIKVPQPEEIDSPPGIGHNNPPPEFALSPLEIHDLRTLLESLAVGASRRSIGESEKTTARLVISKTASKIAAYITKRAAWFEEGFYTQLGSRTADAAAISAWVLVAGTLASVLRFLSIL